MPRQRAPSEAHAHVRQAGTDRGYRFAKLLDATAQRASEVAQGARIRKVDEVSGAAIDRPHAKRDAKPMPNCGRGRA